MKLFWTFVRKELIHIIRDPQTLMILIAMPIVEMLLFGYALNMELTDVRTKVIDNSHDGVTKQVIQKLDHNPTFILLGVTHDLDEVRAEMDANRLDLAIVLPQGVEQSLTSSEPVQIQLIVDASDPTMGQTMTRYASTIIRDAIESYYGVKLRLPYHIEVNQHMLYNPEMNSSYNFVPGIMGLVMVVICTIMTSVSIAREKERGSMELLLASPVKATTIVIAKAVPYFLVSLVNLISILLLSYFVLGVPIRGSLTLIVFCSMIYILVALSIGLVISGMVETQKDAVMMSGYGMMMPTVVFSGMLFPIKNMPIILQWMTELIPAKHYISAIRKLMIQGMGFAEVWQELAILTLFTVILLFISIKSIKPRLQ